MSQANFRLIVHQHTRSSAKCQLSPSYSPLLQRIFTLFLYLSIAISREMSIKRVSQQRTDEQQVRSRKSIDMTC